MTGLIKNVIIYDGSGEDAYPGYVAYEHDKITQTGHASTLANEKSFDSITDGGGLALTPGFIDAHGHSDISLLAAPEGMSKLTQGITSEISGNCGLSPFPITDLNREHLQSLWENYNVPITWHDCKGYLDEVRRRRVSLNLFPLVGHNTLRGAVNGYTASKLSNLQLVEMKNLLRENLIGGALGLSSGLLYVPGKFANLTELTALLQVVADLDGIYALHLRSEGAQLLESITEAITALQSAGGKKLHLSHFKTAGRANWHKLNEALEIINRAAETIHVTCDRYPYIYSMSQLSIISPSPYDDLDDIALMRVLQSEEHRSDFLVKMHQERNESYWKNIQLVYTALPGFKNFCGSSFADIATALQVDAPQLVLEILKQDAPNASAAFGNMSLDNCKKIIALDNCVCGSDESTRPLDYSLGRSHPRNFGSMPEFYRMGLTQEIKPEKMIRKMSSLTAEIFNLPGRGRIAPGYFADLALIDLANYAGKATLINPHQISSGVSAVWINGQRFL